MYFSTKKNSTTSLNIAKLPSDPIQTKQCPYLLLHSFDRSFYQIYAGNSNLKNIINDSTINAVHKISKKQS